LRGCLDGATGCFYVNCSFGRGMCSGMMCSTKIGDRGAISLVKSFHPGVARCLIVYLRQMDVGEVLTSEAGGAWSRLPQINFCADRYDVAAVAVKDFARHHRSSRILTSVQATCVILHLAGGFMDMN